MKRLVVLLFLVCLPADILLDAQPQPIISLSENIIAENKVESVPSYDWQDGCGPTAIGMLVGYWNTKINLFDGAYRDMVSSPEHWNDYAYPVDTDSIQPDKSEHPPGDEHQDNSIADFLKTSQSRYGLKYGVTDYSNIVSGLENYVTSRGYSATVKTVNNDMLSVFKSEIDAGRPVALLVNVGDVPNHLVVGIGYSGDKYLCHTAMGIGNVWFDFDVRNRAKSWSVWSMVTLDISYHKTFLPIIQKGN